MVNVREPLARHLPLVNISELSYGLETLGMEYMRESLCWMSHPFST